MRCHLWHLFKFGKFFPNIWVKDEALAVQTKRYMKQMKNDRAYALFAGLNKDLDKVKGWILTKKPLPSIWEVFCKVWREEAQRNVILNGESWLNIDIEGSAFASKGLDQDGEKYKISSSVISAIKLGTLVRPVGNCIRSLKIGKGSPVETTEFSRFTILIKGNKLFRKYVISSRIN